jgi:hypothetical protein
MQLITAQQIKDRHDVSFHKDDNVIESSISAIENIYVKAVLTKELYAYLLSTVNTSPEPTFTAFLMNGGLYDMSPFKVHINGLIDAVSALVYADLLIKQTVVTRYGAVNKTDTRSQNKDYNELNTQISRYTKIGRQYLDDIREYVNTLDSSDSSLVAQKEIIELIQKSVCYKVDGILNEWI